MLHPKKISLIFFAWLTLSTTLPANAQINGTEYPRVITYFSFVQPVVAVDKNHVTATIPNNYALGFPIGINVLKSDRIGFSFEITPFIRANSEGSKTSNILFHPGIIFRRRNKFSITTRLAFETSGRYGFTTIFSKVFLRRKDIHYFAALPIPVRAGNSASLSIGASLQVGVLF